MESLEASQPAGPLVAIAAVSLFSVHSFPIQFPSFLSFCGQTLDNTWYGLVLSGISTHVEGAEISE